MASAMPALSCGKPKQKRARDTPDKARDTVAPLKGGARGSRGSAQRPRAAGG